MSELLVVGEEKRGRQTTTTFLSETRNGDYLVSILCIRRMIDKPATAMGVYACVYVCECVKCGLDKEKWRGKGVCWACTVLSPPVQPLLKMKTNEKRNESVSGWVVEEQWWALGDHRGVAVVIVVCPGRRRLTLIWQNMLLPDAADVCQFHQNSP